MNKYIVSFFFIVCTSLLSPAKDKVYAQKPEDTLSLHKIIGVVMQNHPSIKQANEAIQTANSAIGLAKSGYYPNIDFSASYMRIGPVAELSFPGMGNFQLYPADNFNAGINIYQGIYDFGKTAKSVAFAKENKNLSQQSLEQVKQKLAFSTTLVYYSMVYLQEAIKINKQQLQTLQNHLDYMMKKQESGSATSYEILSTKVKISATESMGIDLQTGLKNQITEMNALMGQSQNTSICVRQETEMAFSPLPLDSLISFALDHRDDIKMTKEKAFLASLKYKMVKAQDNPILNFQFSGGGKNGYIPEFNVIKANFAAGLGLKIPLFEAGRSKFNLSLAKSNITLNDYETELVKQNATAEVIENVENIKAALKKIERFQLQLNQSNEAYLLAEKSFNSGSLTNLDILDAATNVSESNLLLIKSKVEYILNVFKLKLSIGERLY